MIYTCDRGERIDELLTRCQSAAPINVIGSPQSTEHTTTTSRGFTFLHTTVTMKLNKIRFLKLIGLSSKEFVDISPYMRWGLRHLNVGLGVTFVHGMLRNESFFSYTLIHIKRVWCGLIQTSFLRVPSSKNDQRIFREKNEKNKKESRNATKSGKKLEKFNKVWKNQGV